MKVRSHDPGITAEGDMTPMIDMTFQLIAFFMLMINLSTAETNTKVKLPMSELAKPPKAPLEQVITVHITEKGNTIVAGEEMPVASLGNAVRAQQTALEADGKVPADTTVIVRGHRNVSTGVVQETIQACQKERLTKFVLRAESEM